MAHQLPQLNDLFSIQRSFFRAISNSQSRPWGEITRNDLNPQSHDANHAYISLPATAGQYAAVLAEVQAFYAGAPAKPRVRYYTAISPPNLLKVAAQVGWQTDLLDSTWRAWPAPSPLADAPGIPGLTIHVPTAADLESCYLVRQEDAPQDAHQRIRRTWERLSGSPDVTPMFARIDGQPAAVLAVIWLGPWGCIDEVKTRPCFRRRGLCTALLRFAQDVALARRCRGLMLYDTDEASDRIYARAGFQMVGKTQCATAWRA